MTMNRTLLLIFILCAGTAVADPTPATRPSDDSLAKEIRQLREQVAALTRQVTAIQEKLKPPATKPAEPPLDASTFVLEVVADIDGSDELHITRDGLKWNHKQWDWPSNVTVNGKEWDPHADMTWDTLGVDVASGENGPVGWSRILSRAGRDTIAVEPDADGLIVYYADTPEGGDTYSVKIALTGVHRRPEK
jgi:hypothetical protein